MYSRVLSRVFGCVNAHGHCSVEFEERGSEIRVMLRTLERSAFRRVGVAVLNRFSVNTTLEAKILAKILDVAGPKVSVVSLHGSPAHKVWQRLLQAIWEVGTVPSSWSAPRLIFGC